VSGDRGPERAAKAGASVSRPSRDKPPQSLQTIGTAFHILVAVAILCGEIIMTAKNAADDSSDILSQVKSSASDLGQAAADEIDSRRRAAAAGIKSAAKSLHEKADDLPGGTRVADVAHGAADKLNATGNYVRRRNFTGMAQDVRKVVKDNPVPALVGAAALGFLLAKVFSSRD
jgi:hypothetical protein